MVHMHSIGQMIIDSRTIDCSYMAMKPLTSILKILNSLYMANNGYDYERATQALANGDADLVSFGRIYLANPDLPERFKQGAALNEPDMETFYGGDEHGYTDYPTLS